jgi:riboflavin transporter
MRKNQMQTKFIVLMGLFIAMSVVGGYVKIPNPVTSSVAFDSLPAFLAALVLGGIPGAIVGFLGHMATAAVGGFPLTLPIHLFIGLQMAIIMLIFSFVAKKN